MSSYALIGFTSAVAIVVGIVAYYLTKRRARHSEKISCFDIAEHEKENETLKKERDELTFTIQSREDEIKNLQAEIKQKEQITSILQEQCRPESKAYAEKRIQLEELKKTDTELKMNQLHIVEDHNELITTPDVEVDSWIEENSIPQPQPTAPETPPAVPSSTRAPTPVPINTNETAIDSGSGIPLSPPPMPEPVCDSGSGTPLAPPSMTEPVLDSVSEPPLSPPSSLPNEEPNKHRHSSSHHRRREPSGSSRDDEEPSSSKTRDASVETVERGVGPTPAPPHSSHLDPRNYAPTYYGLPSSFLDFLDFLEKTSPYGASANPYGLPGLPPGFPFYHAPYPFSINPPLPLNSQTLEDRYNWPPPGFHHPMTGLPTSPSHTDVSSLYGLRSPMVPSDSLPAALASRLHWDQLRQNYLSPLSSGRRYSRRRYSPAALQALQGPGFGGGSGYPHDYPSGFSPYGTHSMFTDLPPTPGSGSVTLPGSIDPKPQIEKLGSYYDKSQHMHFKVLLVMKHTDTDEHWTLITKAWDDQYECIEDGFGTNCGCFVVFKPTAGGPNVEDEEKEPEHPEPFEWIED